MAKQDSTHRLDGTVQLEDAYLGGERDGGNPGRGSENKVPFVAAVLAAGAPRDRLAYSTLRTLGELDALLGRRVSRVHVVGGGVKNRLLCQMIADATGRPVVAGPVEATAIGNLLVQLAGREGPVDLRAVRAIVRDSFEPEHYEPRDAARWNERLSG